MADDSFSFVEDSTIADDTSFALQRVRGGAKQVLKLYWDYNKVWFEQAKDYKKNNQEEYKEFLRTELKTWGWPIYNLPKPLKKRLWYCIRKLSLKDILSDVDILHFYLDKRKQITRQKKKKTYKAFASFRRPYYRRRRGGFSRRRYSRRPFRRSYRRYRRSYRRRYY